MLAEETAEFIILPEHALKIRIILELSFFDMMLHEIYCRELEVRKYPYINSLKYNIIN